MSTAVIARLMPDLPVRIRNLMPAETDARGDPVTDELDSLDNPVIPIGPPFGVTNRIIQVTIFGVDPKEEIDRCQPVGGSVALSGR